MTTQHDDKQIPLFSLSANNVLPEEAQTEQETPFSQYIVYVDKSGVHSLQSIDERHPLICIGFLCIS